MLAVPLLRLAGLFAFSSFVARRFATPNVPFYAFLDPRGTDAMLVLIAPPLISEPACPYFEPRGKADPSFAKRAWGRILLLAPLAFANAFATF